MDKLSLTQPVKIYLKKKLLTKQKTIEIFIIDAQAFRKGAIHKRRRTNFVVF